MRNLTQKVPGWQVPETKLYSKAHSIFSSVPLPPEAYVNTYKTRRSADQNESDFESIPVDFNKNLNSKEFQTFSEESEEYSGDEADDFSGDGPEGDQKSVSIESEKERI